MYARQQTEKLGYDAAGNRIRRETEQEITTYRYDNCNRLQELHWEYKNAETSTAQPQMIRYTYDRQGNMLREKSMKSGEEKKYSYDSFGRMVRAEVPVESPGTREFQVQINRYDGEGLRHEMEENGRLIKFLYNEDREVVAEETGNGTITRYIRGLGIISSDSEEAKTYYHYVSDEQGSITHVLSEDAEILNHYSYDAFGNIIQKTEKVENRFCYNGEMLDPVTQQYYLRARFYNPIIGRFTQEDTYYGDGLNLYQYCQANPVGYVDPSGHNICPTQQSLYKKYRDEGMSAEAAFYRMRKELGLPTSRDNILNKSVKRWSNEDIQRAVDSIHDAQYGNKWYGNLNPISVTISKSGNVIVSKNNGVPGPKARAKATQIFGNQVEFVKGGKKSNYQNTARGGNHAEARGIQYMINNGIDTTDAKQATSHYSCRDCADKQKTHNIINITGEASKQKFGAKIGRKKMEDLW